MCVFRGFSDNSFIVISLEEGLIYIFKLMLRLNVKFNLYDLCLVNYKFVFRILNF